jgi:serine/threonine protein phosphatase 1
MLSKFLSPRRSAETAPAGAIPSGERVYAIGDIHGRLDLLDLLLASIDEDDSRRGPAHTRYIFLGDLIDRGPQSAQVIDRVRAFHAARPSTQMLLGNHEEVFALAARGDMAALKLFARIGGRETVLSYGISERDYFEAGFPELMTMLQQAVPAQDLAFLDTFDDMVIVGDYAFVHAGVRPDESLANQRVSDLRWIRDEFLDFRGALEKIVVHGHTITDDVEQRRHRIGIDTGAYRSGRLTAMGFEGSERWVLQAEI